MALSPAPENDIVVGSAAGGDFLAAVTETGLRATATAKYIREHEYVARINRRKGKQLVCFPESYYHSEFSYAVFRITAKCMFSLTLPVSEDGRGRWICSAIVDAFILLHRHRQRGEQVVRNGRRVLLHCKLDTDWMKQHAGEPSTSTDRDDMRLLADQYLQHDLVFLPMVYQGHSFALVVDFREREYQVLDSNFGGIGYDEYVECTSSVRECVARIMAVAGHDGDEHADVARWKLCVVEGLPQQTDSSSCALFMLLYMQLWDGEGLTRAFTMEDVHAFRRKLAEELIFSELNKMCKVKKKIRRIVRRVDGC